MSELRRPGFFRFSFSGIDCGFLLSADSTALRSRSRAAVRPFGLKGPPLPRVFGIDPAFARQEYRPCSSFLFSHARPVWARALSSFFLERTALTRHPGRRCIFFPADQVQFAHFLACTSPAASLASGCALTAGRVVKVSGFVPPFMHAFSTFLFLLPVRPVPGRPTFCL